MGKEGITWRRSKSTIPVGTRLTPEVHAILLRRAKYHPDGISGWLRDRLTYDLTRKHGTRKPKTGGDGNGSKD